MTDKALKRYGQNFLTDKNVITNILEVLPGRLNYVIEIGPGTGALSSGLVEKAQDYTGVELDPRMIEILNENFPGKNFVNSDILKVNLSELKPENTSLDIFGNIPYNISTPLFLYLCQYYQIINNAVLMVQKEAALRIMAPMGSKDYNASNVIVNQFCEIHYMFDVSRNSFSPKPNVDSAIILLKLRKPSDNPEFYKVFSDIVKNAFMSRRKVLKNSPLNKKYGFAKFDSLDKYLLKRAEELTPEDYHYITNTILRK